MSNSKLCISICAKNSEELFERMVRAEDLADVIEVRFDCLEGEDIVEIANKLSATGKNFLLTFRSPEQGGHREISIEQRKEFWSQVPATKWADAEPDIVEDVEARGFEKLICSYHATSNTFANIRQIFALLADTKADVLKIAVPTDAAVDAIPLWNLLDAAKKENKGIIPIAMGEARLQQPAGDAADPRLFHDICLAWIRGRNCAWTDLGGRHAKCFSLERPQPRDGDLWHRRGRYHVFPFAVDAQRRF